MVYFITGGIGFIGSNFIRFILSMNRSDKIICYDFLQKGSCLKNLQEFRLNKSFIYIYGDIRNYKLLCKIFEKYKPDIVVNFAAESHVDRSMLNPELFFSVNTMGTQNILEVCRKYKIKRFHQVSTDEVYGALENVTMKGFVETDKLNPSNPYAASKAAADLIVKAYYKTYGIPITISRSSNNYGPRQDEEKFIPMVISYARQNKKIPIYGNGQQVRDWLYVYDHCEAINLILQRGRIGEIYNVGGHQEYDNIFVAKTILTQLGKSERLITHVEDRINHDFRYSLSTLKIDKELGWKPKTLFEYGIVKTINDVVGE